MRIENVLDALRKNKMDAYYVDTKEEARELALSLIPDGAVCASGGSVTLSETGIADALKSGNYTYIDRYATDYTPDLYTVMQIIGEEKTRERIGKARATLA